jgi:endogenous inhibitor of DNA gyrase (YacG/DUF329 family)
MARAAELRRAAKAAAAGEAAKACAICGKPRDTRYDPFCSKRCADVDLHRWLSGVYVVPGGEPAPDRSEDEQD